MSEKTKMKNSLCFRFYSVGMLGDRDLAKYLKTHALMYEYYRQTEEIVPPVIGAALKRLFTSEAYQIVNTRYVFTFYRMLSI